ncbi:MAG: reverse transcriptase/maturase family protein [bacterium]|nr:reverse transcriptase/maturase family protein [bacterium]
MKDNNIKNDIKYEGFFDFEDIFSYESLTDSWFEFRVGKKKKSDIGEYFLYLSKNILDLHRDIMNGTYKHSGYKHFKIYDPKVRDIHKASIRDRVIHHAIYRAIYKYFDKFFIHDSYSCRVEKGTHKALDRFRYYYRKESLNDRETVWVLKCDIRKCFHSVDHNILKNIIRKYINCPRFLGVIDTVIDSFSSGATGKGIPLGNLTSQIFINIYLNEFDQFIKRDLKIKKYIRYADDFVIFSRDKRYLEELIPKMKIFLGEKLNFQMHPDKVFIKTVNSGVDFLGWVHFRDHKILRTKTKLRMYKKIFEDTRPEVLASYLGFLSYGNAYKLELKLMEI